MQEGIYVGIKVSQAIAIRDVPQVDHAPWRSASSVGKEFLAARPITRDQELAWNVGKSLKCFEKQ